MALRTCLLVLVSWVLVSSEVSTTVQAQETERVKISCKSKNFREKTCSVDGRIINVRLRKQKSDAACRNGESFGFRGNKLWVDRGCSGEFDVTFRPDRRVDSGSGDRPWWEDLDRNRGRTRQERVRCTSRNFSLSTCRVDGPITQLRLRRQRSSARCQQGTSFGYRGNEVWVDRGCDAEFDVTFRSRDGDRDDYRPGRDERRTELTCRSRNGGRESCEVGGIVTRVRVLDRRSSARCREGQSYGFRRDYVWVDRGCSARFEVYYREDDRYDDRPWWDRDGERETDDITCKSKDYGYKRCKVDGRIISIRLRDRKSSAPCRRGESFGFERDYVWVDKGCAAKFDVTFEKR